MFGSLIVTITHAFLFYQELEKLVEQSYVGDIAVCDFSMVALKQLCEFAKVAIAYLKQIVRIKHS